MFLLLFGELLDIMLVLGLLLLFLVLNLLHDQLANLVVNELDSLVLAEVALFDLGLFEVFLGELLGENGG